MAPGAQQKRLAVYLNGLAQAAGAALLAFNRLCAPRSELGIEERWYPTTSLGDLLGIAEGKIKGTRLYRCLDRLLPHKTKLERHLKERYRQVADRYEAPLSQTEGRWTLTWNLIEERRAWREPHEGAYMLCTNLEGAGVEELWTNYIQLTEAEAAFPARGRYESVVAGAGFEPATFGL